MSLAESKNRKMAHRDMKKRFAHHHETRRPLVVDDDAAASPAAQQGKADTATTMFSSPVATVSSPLSFDNVDSNYSSSSSSPCVLGGQVGKNKRFMTMSQLRVAATRAGVLSPLRQLAVAKSPLAQRIRSDILQSVVGGVVGGVASVAGNKAGALNSPLPTRMGGKSPARPLTPRSSSRRQRLHETRFRRRHSLGSSMTTTTPAAPPSSSSSLAKRGAAQQSSSTALLSRKCPTTPLARPGDTPNRFFSPPIALTSARRTLLATTDRKPVRAAAPTALSTPLVQEDRISTPNVQEPNDDSKQVMTPTLPHSLSSSSSRTPSRSKPRRVASSRSPLQALIGASNGGYRSPSSTKAPEANGSNRGAPSGNGSKGVVAAVAAANTTTTRRNLDKRTARLTFGPTFANEIARLAAAQPVAHDLAVPTISHGSPVTVAIRKRPLFPEEAARGEFDVVTMGDNYCTVYKTSLQADMKTATVAPITYPCSVALNEASTNPQVYRAVLKPLVEAATRHGSKQSGSPPPPSSATLLHFGQTGSGKSFTMAGLERELVDDLSYPVSVQYLEVSGKSCRDLLESQVENQSRPTSSSSSGIRVLNSGNVSVVGATWVSAQDSDELLRLLAVAKSLRATQATDRNHESSRSHALVTIRLEDTGACLTLVDCAGTEGSYDCMYHSKDRQAESTEINASLYALKECIRARATSSSSSHSKSVVVPYRSSTLTSILRPHLESGGPLAVVATISPNATDTEHTVGTLKTVATLLGTTCLEGSPQAVEPRGRPNSQSDPLHQPIPSHPKTWDHDELVRFLDSKIILGSSKNRPGSKKPFDPIVVPSTMDGRKLMRMNKMQIANALRTTTDVADKVFGLLRAETARVGRHALKHRAQAKVG